MRLTVKDVDKCIGCLRVVCLLVPGEKVRQV